jgi:hypothetical protein
MPDQLNSIGETQKSEEKNKNICIDKTNKQTNIKEQLPPHA